MKVEQRLPLLDIFRIFICGMVFLFHAVIHKFWIIEQDAFFYPNLATGALYMDAFFLLSGFLLYYLYSDKLQNFSSQTIKNFYLKRIKRIYPHYIVSTVVMCVLIGVVLWAIPIEIFCLQGFFPSLFNKMGNDGTWFISCLFFSYLLFPVLNKLVSTTKKDYLMIFLLYLSIIYTVMLGVDLKIKWVAIYIHPIYRMLEFVVGMYIGKIFINKQLKSLQATCVAILGIILLFVLIPVLYKNNFINHIKFTNNYLYYAVITIPLFATIIYSLACVKNKFVDMIGQSKIIKYLTALTFPFFIWQGVGQKLTKNLIQTFSLNENSFCCLFVVTLIVTIFIYLLVDIVPKYFRMFFMKERE